MIPNVFYHVTTASTLPAIMSEGLLPQIGPRSLDFGEEEACIYFFSSEDAVIDAVTNWLGEEFEEEEEDLVVLEILNVTNPVSSFPTLEESFEWYSTYSVEPEYISLSSINLN